MSAYNSTTPRRKLHMLIGTVVKFTAQACAHLMHLASAGYMLREVYLMGMACCMS